VDPLVFVLVGVAAVIHVAWNVLLKTSGDPLRAATIGMATGAAIVVPVAIAGLLMLRPAVEPGAIALAAVSGLLEATYFVLLAAAYRAGDLSVVYPIARGSAPLIAVVIGIVVLGESIRPAALAGIGLLVVGIGLLQRPWAAIQRLRGRPGEDAAIGFALLTGLAIAGYSAVDRVGVRIIPVWLYAGVMWPVCVAGLLGWAALHRQPAMPDPGHRLRGMVGGVLTLAAYALILVAFTVAPLAVVAPLRESAIVLASVWGVIRLAEAGDRREAATRIAAALLVLVGAVVLALEA
jgi:multidrug transporter EmrE-like cation transporter